MTLQIDGEVAAHRLDLRDDAIGLALIVLADQGRAFSIMPLARSDDQNSTPIWNSREAKMVTSNAGTAAMIEKMATSGRAARPRPRRATPRPPPPRDTPPDEHQQRDTGTRLATSSEAIAGGDSGWAGLLLR